MPMSEDKFIRLFELLDAELHAHGCDHSLKLTEQILSSLEVKDVLSVLAWLEEQGEYCDCEVMTNVEEKFEYLSKISTRRSKFAYFVLQGAKNSAVFYPKNRILKSPRIIVA